MKYRSLTYIHNFKSMFVSHWTNIPSITFINQLVFEIWQNLWCPRYWPLAPPSIMNSWHESRCYWSHLGKASSKISVCYLPSVELKNLPMTKILTMENRPKSEVVWSQQTVKYRSRGHGSCIFLLHSHMKYQLATITRSWDSTLDKTLNLDNLAKFGLVWFCLTALQHILGHFGRGHTVLGQASQTVYQYLVHVLSPVTDNCSSWISGRVRNVFTTKSPWKNVTDVGIELGAACMPSEHASDRATMPSYNLTKNFKHCCDSRVRGEHFQEEASGHQQEMHAFVSHPFSQLTMYYIRLLLSDTVNGSLRFPYKM